MSDDKTPLIFNKIVHDTIEYATPAELRALIRLVKRRQIKMMTMMCNIIEMYETDEELKTHHHNIEAKNILLERKKEIEDLLK